MGLHLSKEQVAELVIPHPHTLELVESWLKYHGVPSPTSLTHGGNWLTLTGVPVSKANSPWGVTKEVIIRTVGYSLPAALHGHVQTVAPTTKRSGGAAAGQVKATSGDPTPFLRWLYNSATYVPAATDQNVLGISGFAQEYPNPVDLTTFINHFHGPQTGATYTVVQVNSGGYNPNNPGIEASVQYTSGMGSSYANYETEFPLDHARTLCDLFMQLGARGVSALIASGDYGVGEGDCMTDGNVRFRPTFPASCPWVTGVGGTLGYPETAAGLGGGGFSEYFERPDYQDDAVTPFFEILGNQYHGLYNASGRGFPAIAAQSYDIAIRQASARLSQPLAVRYRRRAGLNDITSGSNPSCNTDGFSAIEGWDPMCLGSPDFERLQHIANLLP
ncbi:subtilisin-like protein [Lactarius pseudohatsudake]|nr:subtilisin-like protein [Lactarius pseudohatsudake]